MIIHFSVQFAGDPYTYHGDFDTAFNKLTDIAKEAIQRRAKVELSKVLDNQNRIGADITRYEVYTHEVGNDEKNEEVMIFKFKNNKQK